MKWLLSRLRDPSLLPLKVRIFVFVVFLIDATIVYFANADKWHKLSIIAISIGVIGAGILYYETIVGEEVLIVIANQLIRAGSSKKLLLGDTAFGIVVSLIMVLLFLLGMSSILHQCVHGTNQSGLYTILRICRSFGVAAIPPILMYGFQKAFRVVTYRWHRNIENSHGDDRKAEIKRILRLVGFASLVVSGAL